MFKKSFWKLAFLVAVMILAVGCIGQNAQQNAIEVIYDTNGPYWNEAKPLSITDNKIVADILAMIEESKPLTDTAKMDKLSGMARKSKLIVTGTDGSKKEIAFTYDTLYEIGYIEVDGKKLEPKYEFFRYLADLGEYRDPDTNIDKKVAQLFKKYDWTVDYKINTVQEQLPVSLKHKAGEYPTKIYWAYNNELSKQLGFDLTSYLGKDVVVAIYRLRESLPDFLKPRRDARGIVLKHKGQIVGAYIDAGRHDAFACSLDRKGLKDITGKDWNGWVRDYIDYEDELEVRLSKMSPEEVIREYFKALDKQDIKMVWACMTRKSLTQQLSSNLDNKYLFNKDDETDYNIKGAKLLEIKEFQGFQNETGVLEFQVKVDFDFKKFATEDDGIGTRFVLMHKESEASGWRISGVGTGP